MKSKFPETLQDLQSLITLKIDETKRISLDGDLRPMLLQYIREYDFQYVVINNLESELTDNDKFFWFFLRYGTPSLLSGYYEASEPRDVPGLKFQTTSEFSHFVRSILSNIGVLEYVNRNLSLLRMGLITANVGHKKVEFVIEGLSPDHLENKFELESRLEFAEKLSAELTPIFNKHRTEIQDHLRSNVFLSDGFGIGYSTTPALDEYFFALALSRSFVFLDYDLFPDGVRFGGIGFGYYRLATTLMLAFSLKHEAFCAELFRQKPTVKYINILTITGETAEIVQAIAAGVNHFGPRLIDDFEQISSEQAAQIFRIISLNRQNFNDLIEVDMAFPYLIELTPSSIIKSLAGARTNPYNYLRRSLRSTFETDYDKAQNRKELYFYKALERAILDRFPDAQIKSSIKLRGSGKVLTDVDAIVFDQNTRTIILISLKHQDPYASNLKLRRNRRDKLVNETRKWMTAIDQWLAHVKIARFIRDVGFQWNDDGRDIVIQQLVLCKHHAHFLSEINDESKFVYANWAQFNCRLAAESSLSELIERLAEDNSSVSEMLAQETLTVPPSQLIDDIRVEFEVLKREN